MGDRLKNSQRGRVGPKYGRLTVRNQSLQFKKKLGRKGGIREETVDEPQCLTWVSLHLRGDLSPLFSATGRGHLREDVNFSNK